MMSEQQSKIRNKIGNIVHIKAHLLEQKKEIKRQMIQADENHRTLIEEFERLK